MLFLAVKKLFCTSRNEGLAEKYVQKKRKTASTGSSRLLFEKIKENDFR